MIIEASTLKGSIKAPDSKSHGHRVFILSALANTFTTVKFNSPLSEDLLVTLMALKAMGADVFMGSHEIVITPIRQKVPSMSVNFVESGSSLRMLLPVIAALGIELEATGEGKLPERPLRELMELMEAHGVHFSSYKLPFKMSGKLTGGKWEIPGDVSSQYISGLLMAQAIVEEPTEIVLTTELKSPGYVEMTKDVMREFGLTVEDGVVSGKITSPGSIELEGDWSGAAFYLTAGAITGPIIVEGLNLDSSQPDRKILEILEKFGATVKVEKDQIQVIPGLIRGQEISIESHPDLFMPLAVLGAYARGNTLITHASALRDKESDRLEAMESVLNDFGIETKSTEDSLEITGGNIKSAYSHSFNDHRIAMAVTLLAMAEGGSLDKPYVIGKSYPAFYQDFLNLGGKLWDPDLEEK